MKKNQDKQIKVIANLIKYSGLFYLNKLIPVSKSMPSKIGDLFYEKKYEYSSFRHGYSYGVYKNKNGKKYFVKKWTGKFKDFEYQMMKNEEKVLSVLAKPHEEVIKSNIRLRHLKIPKILASTEHANEYMLVYDYIEKDNHKKHSAKDYGYYEEIIFLFEQIGKKLKQKDLLNIQKRLPETIIATYLLGLSKSILNYPQALPAIATNFPYFIMNLETLLSEKNLKLSHRDLYANNIIKNKENITIIDFALCTLTVPYYEQVAILINHWNEKDARITYCKQLEMLKKTNLQNWKLYQLLSIAIATHHLTDSKLPKYKVKLYCEFLNDFKNIAKYNARIYESKSQFFSGIFAISGSDFVTNLPNSI